MKIVITISEEYLNKLNSVADLLQRDGLHINSLYDFGVITGDADKDIINKLRNYKEIVSLTLDKEVNIAPPDSEIQ